MKERSFQCFVFVVLLTLVGGEKSSSTDDEEDSSYDITTNDVDEHDDATSRMLHLINNAAIKIIEAPDLSKVMAS